MLPQTISLCVLSVLLSSPFSFAALPSDCAPLGVREPAVGNSDLLGYTSTASSVTLEIKLEETWIERCLWRRYLYRPRIAIRAPASMVWDSCAGHYVAKEVYGLHDSSDPYGSNSSSTRRGKKMSVRIDRLKFPGIEYEVEIETYYLATLIGKSKAVVRTKPVPPSSPPKTGAGCFHVFHVDATSRTVKVYWQRVSDEWTEYEVIAYEDDNRTSPVFQETGPLSRGFVKLKISLNIHHFVFWSRNGAGRSNVSAVVQIPNQEDVLPALSTRLRSNKENGTQTLTWTRPNSVDVENYTVFWLDGFDRGAALYTRDLVVLPSDSTSFEIKGEGWIGLGLSANAEMVSSGLHAASVE